MLEDRFRRSVETGNRKDFAGAVAPFSDDGEWGMSPLGMGVFKGREAVRLRHASVSAWVDGLIEWNGVYTDFGQARAVAERLVAERG